jgi:hypothetical protein
MEVNSPAFPHNGQIFVEYQVLNRLLGATQVNGRLLHVQQDWLHLGYRYPCFYQLMISP